MNTNEWGDPADTVYIAMLDNTVVGVYKNWKTANEYADRENIKLLKQGHPESFWVATHPVF